MKHREQLKYKKRIIIKIGTALLTREGGLIDLIRLEKLARIVASLHQEGKEIVLVSSGAVGAGMGKVGLGRKPESIVEKQALAAIGQSALLRMYDTFFNEYELTIGQVLLTRDGIENSHRRTNARNTINHLLSMGVIPIINENDTVSTVEIEFGDNDMLSALVAELIHADLLVILTNTDGVFTANPELDNDAKKVNTVLNAATDLANIKLESKSALGSGGMQTKIEAAELCRKHNIDVVIAEGKEPAILKEIVDGKLTGTLFVSETTHRKSQQA
jgi:glutamate 5-kinase